MLTTRRIKQVAADSGAGGGGTMPPAAAASPVLDQAALQRLRDLDPQGEGKLLQRVVEAFNTSTARMLPQMRAAGRSADLNGVRHVAHTLKSSSASLGAMGLSRRCADLEQQVRAGEATDLDAQIEVIAAEIEVVLQALKRLTESVE